ncbi:hypothetical protein DW843_07780 [Ruminococcus sp. AM36-18]|nr:hypothetical protein DW843_07780 [Ruminococcus sp. AM36-18]
MTAPTARTENGCTPRRIITQITKQRSGEMCFEFNKLSSRTENGGTPPRIITQTTKQRSGEICFELTNCLHELRTVAHRGGIYG